MQPENGIYIKSWYDDPNDKALSNLEKFLNDVIKMDFKDIRKAIKTIKN